VRADFCELEPRNWKNINENSVKVGTDAREWDVSVPRPREVVKWTR
jgi:hypothetical protein